MAEWLELESFRSAVKEIASLGQCTLQVASGQQERGSRLVSVRVDVVDGLILLIIVASLLGGQSLFRGVVELGSKRVLPQGKGLSRKFAEAAWEFVYYTFSIVLLGLTMVPEPWMWSKSLVWEDMRLSRIPCEMKLFYNMEMGYYISSFIVLVLVNRRKKDFGQMAFHHLCTCVLMLFSYAFGYTRIGAVVVAIHNLSDPPLHLAKMFNYLNWKPLPDIIFAIFVVVFMVSRIFVYPLVVLRVYTDGPEKGKGRDKNSVEFYLTILLTCLIFVHMFWAYLIFRMINRLLFKKESIGEQGDIRSDSDEDD